MSTTTTRHEPPPRSPPGVADETRSEPSPISPLAVTTSNPLFPDPTVATRSALSLSQFLAIPAKFIPLKPDPSWFLQDSGLKRDIPNCYVSDFSSRSSSTPVAIYVAIISFRSSSLRLI
ncbi:hypothetical protein L484_017411 [Morus notabilis]|uniref:Uncharacterized protein n=1 Tax=Morus notabilis TaxID=981085 RepID=W9RI67_9ROSA|nr:hypothetical protein L484_017411 [Morus notabilis]